MPKFPIGTILVYLRNKKETVCGVICKIEVDSYNSFTKRIQYIVKWIGYTTETRYTEYELEKNYTGMEIHKSEANNSGC